MGWEYISRVMFPYSDSFYNHINDLGTVGWELIHMQYTEDSALCIFKRNKV